MITTIEGIVESAKKKGRKKMSIACAEDTTILKAIKEALDENLIFPILVGNEKKIKEIADNVGLNKNNYEIINRDTAESSAIEAVSLVSSQKADFVMKGLVSTSIFLKAVLDKDTGLRTGRILSHAAILSLKNYKKLLFITDGGMNEHPDLKTKVQIIQNVLGLCNSLDIKMPKIAALAAVETISDKQPETIEAAELSKMSERGQLGNCIVDGPLAIDVALSKDSAIHKNINSQISGDVDVLLTPSMAAGNILAKSLIYLADAQAAGTIVGTSKPVVMLSRSDTAETKLRSIALGVLMI